MNLIRIFQYIFKVHIGLITGTDYFGDGGWPLALNKNLSPPSRVMATVSRSVGSAV